MLTWKLAHRLLAERCLIPQAGPQGCESPRLTALCEELRQIQQRQNDIYLEIRQQAELKNEKRR